MINLDIARKQHLFNVLRITTNFLFITKKIFKVESSWFHMSRDSQFLKYHFWESELVFILLSTKLNHYHFKEKLDKYIQFHAKLGVMM